MTLSSFLTSGHELPTSRLLLTLTVIHPSRKLQKKEPPSPGHPPRMTNFVVSKLDLADRTGTCKLTLFDHAMVPFKVGTVLLITGATMKRGGEKACISLGQESLVDAEPVVGGVEGLRRWAEKERRLGTKKQGVEGKVLERFEGSVGEAGLYTLAELEERVREEEGAWTVWLSLVVGQVNFVRVVRRGMAGVGECCGIPIYSPETTAPCLTCGTVQYLSINPAIIGSLLDETGALEADKLQWTPKAWKEFLGEAGTIGILSGKKGAGDTTEINGVATTIYLAIAKLFTRFFTEDLLYSVLGPPAAGTGGGGYGGAADAGGVRYAGYLAEGIGGADGGVIGAWGVLG
ncbi:hypothetical protein V498_08290, partial [Pseudogymnoascus sp. VKM F-4517 (FW-2822)]